MRLDSYLEARHSGSRGYGEKLLGVTVKDIDRHASEALLVSGSDACNSLGKISRTTLYRLIKSGCIQQVKIGSKSLITKESIDKFVAQLKAVSK